MDKYRNKYRNPSARLQSWDYGSNAAYFVTLLIVCKYEAGSDCFQNIF
jgi:hypothetical protein